MDPNKPKLTPGVVAKALNQSEDIENILEKESVVVQVLGTKIISSEDHKYRLCISDGVHRTSTVLFRPPQRSAQRDPPEDNSVVDIGNARSFIQTLKGRAAWFINSYEVLSSPRDVMGDPVTFVQSSSTPGPSTLKRPLSVPETPTKKPRLETENGEGARRRLEFNASGSTHEIKSLNPYTNKYKILCRVTSKGTLKKWSNSKGEGVVFNVTLEDVSGEIQATAFNQTAEKLFPVFVEGSAFLVSGAQIKPVRDRRYNSTNHNYEMGLTEHTVVVPVEDSSPHASKLPQIKLNLTKLSEIGDKSANDLVDVMGVVVALGAAEEIPVSKGARTATKRELTLRDNSGSSSGGSSVSVTLWDDKAKLFDGPVEVNSTILLIRKAKVSDWKGKSLNAGSGTALLFDPNTSQAQSLSLWWGSCHHEGEEGHINTLSQESNKSTDSINQYASLCEIKEDFKSNVVDGRVGYYVLGTAYVTEIKREKMMFRACENCSKKVSEPKKGEDPQVFVCKSCNTHSKHFSWRYVLNVGLADFTGHVWATAFDPAASCMLGGISASELNEAMENNFKKFDQVLKSYKFIRWRLKIKAKVETWQQETRLKLIIIECDKVNQSFENERLQSGISALE